MKIYNQKRIFTFFTDIIFIISSLLAFALHWARINYPMHLTRTVYFVLTSDTSGYDANTIISALKGFIIPTVTAYILFKIFIYIFRKKNIKIEIHKLFFLCICYFMLVFFTSIILLKAWHYPIIARSVNQEPVFSEFYNKNYIPYDKSKLTIPENKRNLILIFMESMESSFCTIEKGGVFKHEIIPNLTELAEKNINFSETQYIGGGLNLDGTSWTAAGIISKTSGVPFFNPFKTYGGKLKCLSNIISLTDILKNQGYTQIFSMGSEKQFENRDAFLENHGFEVHDINWYKQNGYIPENYKVFWGFEDQKLFPIACKELSALAEKNIPFTYGMLTVDTHFPNGYTCSSCPSVFPCSMMNVLKCSDNFLGNFINWIQSQKWYENTTIVIMGDHCFMTAPENNFITDNSPLSKKEVEQRRRFLNIIINPAVDIPENIQKNRQFSSFDMMPTILEAMGYKIEGGKAALGRSLLNGCPTLIEEYGIKTVTEEIMKRTIQYEQLR